MPAVHYYLGRPAHVLTAAMSRRDPARATAASPSTAASPAAVALPDGPRPAEPAGQRRMPPGASAPRITAAPSSAWAGHWFSVHGWS
jgi:hypothetical protein